MNSPPQVSIILPTYNRAAFLPDAIQSIRAQTLTDWELLVVDDGSTDDTAKVLAKLAEAVEQQVTVIRQENAGPAAARNRGIDAARGEFVAFFDSDDLWQPHHLAACVELMQRDERVDWVFGSAYIEDLTSGAMSSEPPFFTGGRPQAFLELPVREAAGGFVIEGRGLALFALKHNFPAGLQCAVFRKRVFDAGLRLPRFRIGEDFAFHVLALKAGARPAYRKDIHAIYRRHAENSSNASLNSNVTSQVRVLEEMLTCLQDLFDRGGWTWSERWALRRRIAEIGFWKLGYSVHLQAGDRGRALASFRRALRWYPWSLQYWKTYLVTSFRTRSGLCGETTKDTVRASMISAEATAQEHCRGI